ncbi:MAG: glycerate kinase [Micrococcaceae bacterium]
MNYADRRSPQRVAVIPDSFKGTLDARRVAAAIARGVTRAAAEVQREVIVDELPFADGGEGTLDAVLAAWGTPAHACATTDAIGRPCDAEYAISPDSRTGLIEAAQANGLAAVSDVPLRPAEATTRGVGTLVLAALDQGVDEILLTIGGSATTDAGTGLLRELGARFLDASGEELPDGGGALLDLATIDLSEVDPRVKTVTWRIATDVTNPLTGLHGAAHIFGPQKGATPGVVEHLDRCLEHLAEVVTGAGGKNLDGVAGLGAAGGMAALLYAFFTVELVPGWEMVSDALSAAEKVSQANLVFTGEGRFDTQSLDGKVIHGVRQLTAPGVPLVVLAGQVAVDDDALRASGVTAAFSIGRGPGSLEDMAPQTAENLTWTAYQVTRLLLTP